MSKDRYLQPIDLASTAADQFVHSYYNFFDVQRAQLRNLYKDASIISWNGTAYHGLAYREFYLTLPVSHHRIEGYDAQPILASTNPDGTCSFLITVTGTVKYGNRPKPQSFSDTFILSPSPDQPNVHYISAECFRFV